MPFVPPPFKAKTQSTNGIRPQYLSAAGILPSTTTTYTSSAVLAALKAPRGFDPIIKCSAGELNEIWYFYNVRGSVRRANTCP